ncbi:uncharacterized protein LOC132755426, partial [Ruditapes philippinarum]|uniref:uncharacterized protein LOC132755426 n=1 Tax=Ruditapes philippinarum TaxID=129788 RepID=UPI00295C1CCF
MSHKPENRINLFRLQILIIDGGLLVLRSLIDQTLTAQGITLSACLNQGKPTITHLKNKGVITQEQYDILFPTDGHVPTTSEMDLTLIFIFLLRCLRCFGLNRNFDWKASLISTDVSIEADICRLKAHRNDISHKTQTTDIEAHDFVTLWKDIEQILVRLSSPALNIQQTIDDFKTCPLDPEEEKRVQEEIQKWKDYEADVDRLKEEMTNVKERVTEVEKTQEEIKTRLEEEKRNEVVSFMQTEEGKYQNRKKELKEDLMRFYKWSHSKVLLSPLFEEKDTPLASFYIRPELTVKKLQELFKTWGVANREIYLKADAGLGKTTFSKYLATSWYQAHCPDKDVPHFEKNDIYCMRDFDFVFLVLLRDSNTSCSVDELIFKLIVSNLVNSKSFTEEFMQELLSRENCLVILDGLDEWTHPNRNCERAPRSIPHRNVRENCTILTTTRPWKLGDLNLSSNELGKTVELTELNYYSARTLIRRALLRLKSPPHNMSIEIDDATLVNEIFNSRVAHLAYVPLLLMYMICLRCEGFNIGNSKCELYVKIVELLLLRTTQKYGDISQTLSSSDVPACFTEHDKCKEYFPLLVNLGQLAYHTLSNKTRENTLVFDGSVTEKYLTPEEMKFTLHSGILSQSTTTNLTKKVSKVSFSHKTVQEFFAAIFISYEKEAQSIVLEKCRTVQDILDMSKIWEFVIELNSDRMCAISNDLMSVINEDEITRDYRTRTRGEDILREIIELFSLKDLSHIQKLHYIGSRKSKKEAETNRILFPSMHLQYYLLIVMESNNFQRPWIKISKSSRCRITREILLLGFVW